MAVFNLGSINIDHVYRVPHLPLPGETLAVDGYHRGLGGKGANQSVAALRAGAKVVHIGAIGADDTWIADQLGAHGLSLEAIARVPAATGHAVIAVDPAGENSILIHPGANRAQSPEMIARALLAAGPDDSLMLQNETSHQSLAARAARARGSRVFYSAAPFELPPLLEVLGHATHLLLNALEAEALMRETGTALRDLPVEAVVVTRGAAGAEWIGDGAAPLFVPAFKVQPVDTTGAGDCFAGSLVAGLDRGLPPAEALRYAAAAAALQVTRLGAAEAMPERAEAEAFLAAQ
ncbi:MAG: ribokinase [Pararhodobacter sp.]